MALAIVDKEIRKFDSSLCRRGKDKGQCALMTGASRDVSMEVSQGTPALSRMTALMHLQLQLVMQVCSQADAFNIAVHAMQPVLV